MDKTSDVYEKQAKELSKLYATGNKSKVRDILFSINRKDALNILAYLMVMLSFEDGAILRRLLMNKLDDSPMSPKEFTERMRLFKETGIRSVGPYAAVFVASDLLKQLGYDEGAKILEDMVEWLMGDEVNGRISHVI